MEQEQIDLLLQQGEFPHSDQPTELISTHISWVFLTDQWAYKIKKPVHFSFLDFSTLDKRKYFAEQEYTLNRRLAPHVYLAVLPIRQKANTLQIGGTEGQIVDYALKMRRLDTQKQMNVLLDNHQVGVVDLTALVDQLVAFHRSAEKLRGIVDLQQWQQTFNDLAQIQQATKEWGMPKVARIIDRGIQFSDRFLERLGHRFQQREEEGWIIDGHGDLHAKNIFLTNPPVIFDCIEFSDELRQLDVLNELAFFCMDMDAYQRPDLGRLFLQFYLQHIPCMPHPEDRLIFDYFKLYRANVRLKVNGLQGLQSPDEADSHPGKEQVSKYAALFATYLNQLESAF